MIDGQNKPPGYLSSVIKHKCSRCRTGNMFLTKNSYNLKQFMKMYDKCPSCDQYLEIEVGFYYGTGYLSYGLTVAFSAVTFLAWWGLIGFSLADNRLFWWIGVNIFLLIVCQPYLMRLSRALWLSFFISYNANWKTEKPEDPERR